MGDCDVLAWWDGRWKIVTETSDQTAEQGEVSKRTNITVRRTVDGSDVLDWPISWSLSYLYTRATLVLISSLPYRHVPNLHNCTCIVYVNYELQLNELRIRTEFELCIYLLPPLLVSLQHVNCTFIIITIFSSSHIQWLLLVFICVVRNGAVDLCEWSIAFKAFWGVRIAYVCYLYIRISGRGSLYCLLFFVAVSWHFRRVGIVWWQSAQHVTIGLFRLILLSIILVFRYHIPAPQENQSPHSKHGNPDNVWNLSMEH